MNLNKLNVNTLRDLREMVPREDDYLSCLNPREALDLILRYHGIIGYTEIILSWWKELEEASR
jgi:hypothetical protein